MRTNVLTGQRVTSSRQAGRRGSALALWLSRRAQCCDAGPQPVLKYLVLPYEVVVAARGQDPLIASASCWRSAMTSTACMSVSSGSAPRPPQGAVIAAMSGAASSAGRQPRRHSARAAAPLLQGSSSRSRRSGASCLTAAGCVAARSAARSAARLADVPRRRGPRIVGSAGAGLPGAARWPGCACCNQIGNTCKASAISAVVLVRSRQCALLRVPGSGIRVT